MKTMLMAVLAAGLFLFSCSEKKTQEKSPSEVDQAEVMALDSVANVAEQVEQEIKESAENLDAVLEELDN